MCEPDEYAKLAKELKASGLIKDHRSFLTVHKNSFVGKEFVDWIVETKKLGKNVQNEGEMIQKHIMYYSFLGIYYLILVFNLCENEAINCNVF